MQQEQSRVQSSPLKHETEQVNESGNADVLFGGFTAKESP